MTANLARLYEFRLCPFVLSLDDPSSSLLAKVLRQEYWSGDSSGTGMESVECQ